MDRFIAAITYLSAIYKQWRDMGIDRTLSFYLADANLFAPGRSKDLLDSLQRYQKSARSALQVYTRISRGQNIRWTLDFQSLEDLDDVVLDQTQEKIYKRNWCGKTAKEAGVDVEGLKGLSNKEAIFDNMMYNRKLLVRPPRSRKAEEGEYLPKHFAQAYRRWKDEEDNY